MIDMDNQEQYKAIESVIKERLKFDKARLKIQRKLMNLVFGIKQTAY